MKPSKERVKLLFNPKMREAHEWVEGTLVKLGVLQYGVRVSVEDISFEDGFVWANALDHSDEYRGQVEVTIEDLLEILEDPSELERKVEARKEEERIRKENLRKERQAEVARLKEIKELQEYERLKKKFEK